MTYKIRITARGKEALQTVFNAAWVEKEISKQDREQELKERKIRVAESNARWIKIGAIAAIIAGFIGAAHFAFTTIRDASLP